MAYFSIKKSDRLPAITDSLLQADGTAYSIPGGATLKFKMRKVGNTTYTVDTSATITDATTGAVSYTWGAADTTTAGRFNGEWEVTTGGVTRTFPRNANREILIYERA